jgi:glyoxylase-like metal-dependent hydrolase (beta-lactamase superfamily II)
MTDVRFQDLPDGVTTIDTLYERPGCVASHLIVEGGQAAFVDVGTGHAAPILLEVLRRKAIAFEDVTYVMVTHVHLDHAGAAGQLMRALPRARLVVHPRGARHMIDPAKLIAGAAAVYGADEMQAKHGEIAPVPAERVIEVADGVTLELAGRPLLFVDTPGHARHHYCVIDAESRGIFAGDTFGISYRELDTARGPFIFPTTTPVQFDPEALHASVERLLTYRPERMYLTHFGCVSDVARLASDLHQGIDAMVAAAERAASVPAEERDRALREGVGDALLAALAAHGSTMSREQALALLAMDIELNSQGLGVWLETRGRAA